MMMIIGVHQGVFHHHTTVLCLCDRVAVVLTHTYTHTNSVCVPFSHTSPIFIAARYMRFDELIAKCYPGEKVALEFDVNDLLSYFTSIASARAT